MNCKQLSQQGMKEWRFVRTLDDVYAWHKVYTPFWSEKDLREIILPQYIRMEEEGVKEEEMLQRTEFEKAYLDSI